MAPAAALAVAAVPAAHRAVVEHLFLLRRQLPVERRQRGEFAKLTAPERLSKMIEMTKQREAKMEAHLTALTAFYGQLTPEQKKVFDERGMGGKRGGHGWRHHG